MERSQATLPHAACIGIGSNLGDRRVTIARGLDLLRAAPGIRVESVSSFIETEPVGPIPQPKYLNAAALLRTSLSPRDLLTTLLDVEVALGRDRSRQERWGPRTLDLDLLLYDVAVIDEPGLTLPHPRMHERPFVLTPLSQIAGGFHVPTLQVTVSELARRLRVSPAEAAAVQEPNGC